ncbi:diacylglycerol/lipid kinase family protein [Cytobacillus purgationiresistens]|uniref:YegS/Rv2252/BmrU family lipid kinase n=1 Tax=Cytobacillus purgationiresistens TaxID=863449 RepID=A0ABU0ALU4_9BACI|nr:diacylglycerol kinase family protein [Cytobacillus purgationiresistens]MDQ0272229.1 YegS/Rv2252/BmrU family lipid kinase [Cytobacillus purgationiresistens]
MKLAEVNFIINPVAQNGYCLKVWSKLEKKLLQSGVGYKAFFTSYHGHAKNIAELLAVEANGEEAFIVAVGGDGTIHEIINGICGYANIKIAFIPCGSGNDFARGFSISKNPQQALLDIIQNINGKVDWIDVGVIQDKEEKLTCFINNMGCGFDALIAQKVNQSKLKRVFNRLSMGKLIYVIVVLKELLAYQPSELKVIIDGREHRFKKVWFITISNQPYFGGGMKISPNASPRDGLLNITVVHHLSRIRFLLLFASVYKGNHVRYKEVLTYTGTVITIGANSPLYTHADGELIGQTPMAVSIKPNIVALSSGRINEKRS